MSRTNNGFKQNNFIVLGYPFNMLCLLVQNPVFPSRAHTTAINRLPILPMTLSISSSHQFYLWGQTTPHHQCNS